MKIILAFIAISGHVFSDEWQSIHYTTTIGESKASVFVARNTQFTVSFYTTNISSDGGLKSSMSSSDGFGATIPSNIIIDVPSGYLCSENESNLKISYGNNVLFYNAPNNNDLVIYMGNYVK